MSREIDLPDGPREIPDALRLHELLAHLDLPPDVGVTRRKASMPQRAQTQV